MESFIVLGIIPGTSIQLDFNDWLLICVSLMMSYVVASYVTHHFRTFSLASLHSNSQNTALSGSINSEEALA